MSKSLSRREFLSLAELTVPGSQPNIFDRWQGLQVYDAFNLYYGSNHWIADIVDGPDQQECCKIKDDLYAGFNYFIPTKNLRIIPADEMTAISADLPFKRSEWKSPLRISLLRPLKVRIW